MVMLHMNKILSGQSQNHLPQKFSRLEFLYSEGKIEQYFYNHGYKKILMYGNGHWETAFASLRADRY